MKDAKTPLKYQTLVKRLHEFRDHDWSKGTPDDLRDRLGEACAVIAGEMTPTRAEELSKGAGRQDPKLIDDPRIMLQTCEPRISNAPPAPEPAPKSVGEIMSFDVALDFARNPRPYHTLEAPADTNGELYEALTVLADAIQALEAERVGVRNAARINIASYKKHLGAENQALQQRVAELEGALEVAIKGLSAGCDKYASRTLQGHEVPEDEQFPWVRLMQIGRDKAIAALHPTPEAKKEGE